MRLVNSVTVGRMLHRILCRLGFHLPYETFRYAPQGFASTVYKVQHRCFVCKMETWSTAPYVTDRKPEETFKCAGCGKDKPWSQGASDDMPEHCDECWSAAHAGDSTHERICGRHV